MSQRSGDEKPREARRGSFTAVLDFWDQAQPYLAHIRPLLTQMLPFIISATAQTKSFGKRYVAPYYNDEVGQMMWNVILVFFGGQFALTIMAIQAFQFTGSVVIKNSMDQLRQQFNEAMTKFQADPDAREIFDKNNDGVITLDEVSEAVTASFSEEASVVRERARKLVSVCLRCIDPTRLSEAFSGFMMGTLAIIATLRSKLAKCIAVGAKIGEHLASFLRAKTQKHLYEKFPEHTSWVDVGLKSGSALIGIIVSFLLMKVINAFNCALQGAESLTAILLGLAHKRGRLMDVRPNDNAVQALTMGIVFVGVMTQVKSGFNLPWYVKLMLLPAVVTENLLSVLAVV